MCAVAALMSGCETGEPGRARPGSGGKNGDRAVAAAAAKYDLVELREVVPDIVVDLRYARQNAVTGSPLYPARMPCLVRRGTAEKLKRVQAVLRSKGYGLCVWDAWRPPEAQLYFMRHAPDPDLFLDPEKDWSGHCAGVSVDVTLVDFRGRLVEMPTDHDESSVHTGYRYSGADKQVAGHVWLLQSTMHENGFSLVASEWWHFDDTDHVGVPTRVVFGREVGLQLAK
jgi:D-alanyl-D-alanine dipeptidase